ncbi:MAG: ion transporter [Syntrophotaleaceae bacterium]
MAVLGFLWMALLILELVYGLNPVMTGVFNVIWGIFILDFLVELFLAKDKLAYLKANLLVAVSLAIPAIRILRIFPALRLLRMAPVVRGIRMARLLTSFSRSMRALSATIRRRGFAYVAMITVIAAFLGAAGMYAFETGEGVRDGFTSYWDALWWTAMLLTTIGSQYWPVTPEGRILALILSIYGVSVLGYIAAVLASYFIGQDAEKSVQPEDIRRIEERIGTLREDILQMQVPREEKKMPGHTDEG